jgi:hypothetical protein
MTAPDAETVLEIQDYFGLRKMALAFLEVRSVDT